MIAKLAGLRRSPLAVVVTLVAILLVVNISLTPSMLAPAQLPNTLNLLVPSVLVAMASTPSVMSGRGGIDLSVGPLLGVVNVFLVGLLVPYGLGGAGTAIPILLVLGIVTGLVSGALVAFGRLQPVVVTLGGYLVLSGVALVVMPQPVGGVPDWVSYLSGSWFGGYLPRSVLLVVVAVAVWLFLKRRGAIGLILATGSDDRAAHTSGVRVSRVLCLAYATGGLFAALAGIGLSVLIQSGDPSIGKQYTLAAVAAVALGGNPLGGGRGTLVGPILGALSLFLIQTLLSGAHVSSLWIQVVYGAVLLFAICTNSSIASRLTARPALGSP
ncbi:MAG TPA: ABC transporter permease [Amycolatopsis sp.]|nr:ABC transporter permease [Amycolatopsis sp.]